MSSETAFDISSTGVAPSTIHDGELSGQEDFDPCFSSVLSSDFEPVVCTPPSETETFETVQNGRAVPAPGAGVINLDVPTFDGTGFATDYLRGLKARSMLAGFTEKDDRDLIEHTLFVEGLKGSAKVWYKTEVTKEIRASWDGLKEAFATQFHEKTAHEEETERLVYEIVHFKRGPIESLRDFLLRADALMERIYTKDHERMLCRSLFSGLWEGGYESPIASIIREYLASRQLLDKSGQMVSKACTYSDMLYAFVYASR
ncbi:hypothetical protein CMQ_5317 [Grosmannia clavigera kw1407]|uniref:Retrotransposon gag domain-containing protein n=1 Tax=Grosmannia clavigera (strain kw1407 / UAMH 11150) TaxID=655863 RepID=F0XBC4_GROCL|nr:uncharacterized protein CMQ_5317 [Grosmannia clavigera kw1407]EFX05055.1 hypothetical protein CMQ_5317 [Grosmannia clavigera kw1407]